MVIILCTGLVAIVGMGLIVLKAYKEFKRLPKVLVSETPKCKMPVVINTPFVEQLEERRKASVISKLSRPFRTNIKVPVRIYTDDIEEVTPCGTCCLVYFKDGTSTIVQLSGSALKQKIKEALAKENE